MFIVLTWHLICVDTDSNRQQRLLPALNCRFLYIARHRYALGQDYYKLRHYWIPAYICKADFTFLLILSSFVKTLPLANS